MHPNMQKLITALRGNEFRQAVGQLKDGGAHCCLGVACELYRRDTGQGKWDENDLFVIQTEDGSNASYGYDMPAGVGQWLGLRERTNDIRVMGTKESGESRFASELNDLGKDFPTIADKLEEQYR